MKPSVLVIEEDALLNQMLVRVLTGIGYEVGCARTWQEAGPLMNALAPDLVLLDVELTDAVDARPLARLVSDRPTVMLAAAGSIDRAVRAIRLGAADYLVKPIEIEELEVILQRVLELRRLQAGRALDHAVSLVRRTPDLVGESPVMRELRDSIVRVAGVDGAVLVNGEGPVGNEVVAHEVHRASSRASGRFVAIDCGALPERSLEAELFGHARGESAGAERSVPGLLEAADGGTLFLAGIDGLGAQLQARLLRVLETGRFRRVGSVVDLRVDVRIVAAAPGDLRRRVRQGTFSADLYQRLSALVIDVPAPRDDRDELVRRPSPAVAAQGPSPAVAASILDDEPTLDEIARRYMAVLLARYSGNRRRVAEALGISERTAYRMLERFGLK